ncbi:MAG: alpha-L-fucosidase [Puniceicoccales bacterium]|jgi:alpha-L-fucosidase|nr:alpha-L-fucosidase [Puniceicoccales bacterium]
MKRPPLLSLLAFLSLCATAFETPNAAGATQPAQSADAAAKREQSLRLPKSDVHYRMVRSYVEDVPDADYRHASEAAHEAFRDIKFSVRIHWGVYSMRNLEASWPYLRMPAKQKMEYQELYKKFNPVRFNADEWMEFFKRCGMQAFAFTSKHPDGFSMFHTKTRVKRRANYLAPPDKIIEECDLAYSIEETPFKRDIVKELCDAGRRHGLKINLYYTHPDWYDADFRPYNYHALTTRYAQTHKGDYGDGIFNMRQNKSSVLTPEPTPEETARMVARHREQLCELLTNYGKIDMICLDQWLGKDVWPQTKETIKIMRKLQPDVMLRARGIGNYGDYYQPEQVIPGKLEDSNLPWMSICLLGKIFAYDPIAKNYKGTGWVINNLVDCVAKGGSFMVCIGPDATGLFHPEAVKQLEAVGDWLKVNGEGIYDTRADPKKSWKKGANWITRSKDGKRLYVFTQKWPKHNLLLPDMNPADIREIRLLGFGEPLRWSEAEKNVVKVEIPEKLQSPKNRPCEYAWCFRLELK